MKTEIQLTVEEAIALAKSFNLLEFPSKQGGKPTAYHTVERNIVDSTAKLSKRGDALVVATCYCTAVFDKDGFTVEGF